MTEQINLRLDRKLIRECEELAEYENLDRAALVKKVLSEGLARERLNLAIQKYVLREITIERAAEIARVSVHEIILTLSRLGISPNISRADLEKLLE